MKYYADLHIHSRFSRATSKELNLENLSYWAQLKGIQVVGTGDCLHPGWLKELKEKLEPAEEGFYKLKNKYQKKVDALVPAPCRGRVRFLLSAEISSIYKKNDKVRKVHNVIFLPSLDAAVKLRSRLEKIGNLNSDGRPILGLDSKNLLEMVLESDSQSYLVPAHVWTPWFSVLGSKSGFNSIQECFDELTPHIFALETGLSSDPTMNWRLSQLDDFVLISNSDAHSAQKLGREANIFDAEFSYPGIFNALKDPKDKGFLGTVEFFPEEGKYHYDGHRACLTRLHPKETIKNKGNCPVCGKPVTVGVMSRVEELADHPEGRKSPRFRPFTSLIPLPEIISEARGVGPASKAVTSNYMKLLNTFGNELFILRDADLGSLHGVAGNLIVEGIRRTRKGEVEIKAGYDGEYGVVGIFSENERDQIENQMLLF